MVYLALATSHVQSALQILDAAIMANDPSQEEGGPASEFWLLTPSQISNVKILLSNAVENIGAHDESECGGGAAAAAALHTLKVQAVANEAVTVEAAAAAAKEEEGVKLDGDYDPMTSSSWMNPRVKIEGSEEDNDDGDVQDERDEDFVPGLKKKAKKPPRRPPRKRKRPGDEKSTTAVKYESQDKDVFSTPSFLADKPEFDEVDNEAQRLEKSGNKRRRKSNKASDNTDENKAAQVEAAAAGAASSEEEDLADSDGQERDRLKALIKGLALWPLGQEVPKDYDVFQGLSPKCYGLKYNAKVHKIPAELIILLLESPIFTHRPHSPLEFMSLIFRMPEEPLRIFVQQTLKWFAAGAPNDREARRKFRIPVYVPVVREMVKHGFTARFDPPFAPSDYEGVPIDALPCDANSTHFKDLNDLLKAAPTTLKGKVIPSFLSGARNKLKSHKEWEHFAHATSNVLGWLHMDEGQGQSASLPKVTVRSKGYTHQLFQWYWKTLVPEFRCNGVFAMVGVAVTPPSTSGFADSATYEAAFLARLSTAPSADEEQDFRRLYKVMTEVLGISFHDVYRNSYSLARPEATQAQKAYYIPQPKRVNHGMYALSNEEREAKVESYRAEITKLAERGDHTVLTDFPRGVVDFGLVFPENMDLSKINNICVLSGDSVDNVQAQTLLTEECFQQLQGKTDPNPFLENIGNKKVPFALIDIYCTLYGYPVCHIFDHLKEYEDNHAMLRGYHSFVNGCKEMAKGRTVICHHCGRELPNGNQAQKCAAQTHIKKCQLERSNCQCKGLVFKNARDKRRHMLLVHSNAKYFGCNDCSEVFKSQAGVDSHYVLMHGVPGQGVACDLCHKNFQSYNHLRIHRLHHESYLCQQCQPPNTVEIVGRIPYKNHMKNYHNYGVHCKICGKWCATDTKLNFHIKENHEDKSYLNN